MEEEREYYEGECFGGPLHGKQMKVRFPKGFLCVDKPNAMAWLYRYNEEGQFHAGQQVVLDHGKRLVAAEEHEYDVVSV